MRKEQDIFDDLTSLCTKPGYAHAVAFLCFRDNFVGYKDILNSDDYAKLYSTDRLIRTEMSTLIGLMARAPIDLTLPTSEQIQEFIEQSDKLLNELHQAMLQPIVEDFPAKLLDPEVNPFESANSMREPIFYSAESAYSFQYRDLALQKYSRDNDWLEREKGFSIADGNRLVVAILDFLQEKLPAGIGRLRHVPRSEWTLIDCFTFTCSDIVTNSGLTKPVVENFLNAFSYPNDGNPTFTSLHEFNSTNAYPIIKTGGEKYILFQYVSLTEALYDTPFYWMAADKEYEPVAMANRGKFAEEFATDRLRHVFGSKNVFHNIDVWGSKRKKISEIDTLVIFANRAIVIQAKSKKLTLAARKGNDLQLRSDFKNAVQDACDQAFICSEQISLASSRFTDADGEEIRIPQSIDEVFPICLVADHFPALSFQAHQFLKFKTTEKIKAPLICDVFLLDVVTEMLESPLRCLSYFELRALAGNQVMFSHENTALSFHLKQNLWLGEHDFMHLHDDISTDLDIAMAVRRDGIEGARTPSGILTILKGQSIGRIIDDIENLSDPAAIGIGLELLKINGKSLQNLSEAIDKIGSEATKDGKPHDVTIALGEAQSGVTVHCNYLPDHIAAAKLKRHCELRKYSQKAHTWIGLAIIPGTATLRFGTVLKFAWHTDPKMEDALKGLPKAIPVRSLQRYSKSRLSKRKKIGRNERCDCGSGLKYKNCCLRKK